MSVLGFCTASEGVIDIGQKRSRGNRLATSRGCARLAPCTRSLWLHGSRNVSLALDLLSVSLNSSLLSSLMDTQYQPWLFTY